MNAIKTPQDDIVDPATMPNGRKFLIFGVMAFGMFLALLDIQVVAASLNDVQAGLSAGPNEISWVQTAYLMAELVMIPFSAFLAQAMSTRCRRPRTLCLPCCVWPPRTSCRGSQQGGSPHSLTRRPA